MPKAKKPDPLDKLEPTPEPASERVFVSTGLTLLNLALTNDPMKGWLMGAYYNIIGHSSTGKTFLGMTGAAELSVDPRFDDYRIFHDNPEDGALMNAERYFGAKAAKRIKAPRLNADRTRSSSETVEDFYDNLHAKLEAEKPFYYLLDSNDALSSESEQDKDAQQRKQRETGKEVAGSYGDGKAKFHSSHLRQAVTRLVKKQSLLIILSQTRENIDPMSMEKFTRSGGKALKFYATCELWLTQVKALTKVVNEKPREIGSIVEIRLKKNRTSGKNRRIRFVFHHETGLDDISSNIDWMLEEGFWKGTSQDMSAPEFNFKGKRREFIRMIEEEDRREALAVLVGQKWNELESKLSSGRKSKYSE